MASIETLGETYKEKYGGESADTLGSNGNDNSMNDSLTNSNEQNRTEEPTEDQEDFTEDYREDLSDLLSGEHNEEVDDNVLHHIREYMMESLSRLVTSHGEVVFVNGMLNVQAEGLLGEAQSRVHDYFLMKGVNGKITGGKPIDEIADIMLSHGVAPDFDPSFILSVLCCKQVGDIGLKSLVSRRISHSKLAEYYEEHRLTYQNNNTRKACDQAVSEIIEYSIYALSCNNLFGLMSETLEGEFITVLNML